MQEEGRALPIHEQQLAGAELPPPGVVVDAECQPASVHWNPMVDVFHTVGGAEREMR